MALRDKIPLCDGGVKPTGCFWYDAETGRGKALKHHVVPHGRAAGQ